MILKEKLEMAFASPFVRVSENASETQIDTTMTFTVLIVSIEQNEEFQESRVHYTLAEIKSLLKIPLRNPWNPPLVTPLVSPLGMRTRSRPWKFS